MAIIRNLTFVLGGSLLVQSDHATYVSLISSKTEQTEQKETYDHFSLGPWRFHFFPAVPNAMRLRIREIFEKAYPVIQTLIGKPSTHRTGNWTIKLIEERDGIEFVSSQTLGFSLESSDALKIHELVHLFQGMDFPEINWIREGTSVAISNIVAQRLGIQRWDADIQQVIHGNNLNQYSGQAPLIPYEQNSRLQKIRYYIAGKFWEEVLQENPQSLLNITRSLRTFYEQAQSRSLHKDEVEKTLAHFSPHAFFNQFLGLVPQAVDTHQNLFPDSSRQGASVSLLYAHYSIFAGKPKIDVLAVRRDSDTTEQCFPIANGEGKFLNPETGLMLILPMHTNERGATITDIADLRDKIGQARVYEATFHLDGFREEHLLFSIP